MDKQKIISLLPYSEPFLFVDTLEVVTEDQVVGHYTYREDAFFYRGHFQTHPIMPGVSLTETPAKYGWVCTGI